jgi:hypothetical protein
MPRGRAGSRSYRLPGGHPGLAPGRQAAVWSWSPATGRDLGRWPLDSARLGAQHARPVVGPVNSVHWDH